MILRDYQTEAVRRVEAAFQRCRRTMLVLPTGMGKTEVFVQVAKDWQAGRVLVVAPQIELVGQAAKKIAQRTGIAPAIEQAELRSNEDEWLRSPFIVASKQTLCSSSRRYERLQDVSLVIIDECHMAATRHWTAMLEHYDCPVLGVTATPKRHDGKAMANIFEDVAYELYIADAVPEGWLVKPTTVCVQLEHLDLKSVGSKRGSDGEVDFKDGELARAMEDEKVVYEIAAVTAKESGRLKTAVFCASVVEARKVANYLADNYGLKADWICGDKRLCSDARRHEVMTSFTTDPEGVQIVCNVGVLTTGWDFPGLEHIVMARPTKSLPLYTQILGRGTRPLPGVVDFAGSTPDSRRAAIAASAKPTFKVTDLVDASLQHKLIGAADVLGGTMGLDVIARAKEKLKSGQERDLEDVLNESQREYEEAERRRLARVAAEAQYNRVTVDPFNARQSATSVDRKPSKARIPFGKHKGHSVSVVPKGYLEWMLRECKYLKPWLRDAISDELAQRGAATPRAKATVDEVNQVLMEF